MGVGGVGGKIKQDKKEEKRDVRCELTTQNKSVLCL
jgi:hypothetical protein